MNSVITTILGIIFLLAALFFAFGGGVDVERNRQDGCLAAAIALFFALIAVLLLLIRS